jgi:pyruvate kinase
MNPETFVKTKILCTLGPATNNAGLIEKMMSAGMNGVRLNFSHGDYTFYEKIYNEINTACIDERTPLAILVDLQGPKIRIGELEGSEVEIATGDNIEITTKKIIGNKKLICTSYKQLTTDARVGDQVLIDDGLIRLRIIEIKKDKVICNIENGGILKPRKGMNLPGMKLSTKSMTEKDYQNLEFAMKYRVDYVALSFVRDANDIFILKKWMQQRNFDKPIIAKIEKKEAVENFDEILKASDGIMVARGDLGVELSPQDVPAIQKEIINKCNCIGKLVITATQMLETMVYNPIPTRAEASDVANAVWDGTDAVMLSAETSVGKHALRTVQTMHDIIKNAEDHYSHLHSINFEIPEKIEENLFDSVGRAVSHISQQVKASAIAVFTLKGRTAKNLAKFRPNAKIIAFSDNFDTMNNLCLRWGVTSIFLQSIDKENIAIDKAKNLILESGFVKEGEVIIFAAGAPYSDKSRVNWLRFEVI